MNGSPLLWIMVVIAVVLAVVLAVLVIQRKRREGGVVVLDTDPDTDGTEGPR